MKRRAFIAGLGGVAACGAGAAIRPDEAHRRADGLSRERPGSTGLYRGIPGGTTGAPRAARLTYPAFTS